MAFLTIDMVSISWGNVDAAKLIVVIHTNNFGEGSDGGSHVHRSVSVSEKMRRLVVSCRLTFHICPAASQMYSSSEPVPEEWSGDHDGNGVKEVPRFLSHLAKTTFNIYLSLLFLFRQPEDLKNVFFSLNIFIWQPKNFYCQALSPNP